MAKQTKRDLQQLPAVDIEDLEWGPTRFERSTVKSLIFQDGVAISLQRFDPGAHTFAHKHPFPQYRFVLEGEITVNGHVYGPGNLITFPEEVFYEAFAPVGGRWLLLQVPGSTGKTPTDKPWKEYVLPDTPHEEDPDVLTEDG